MHINQELKQKKIFNLRSETALTPIGPIIFFPSLMGAHFLFPDKINCTDLAWDCSENVYENAVKRNIVSVGTDGVWDVKNLAGERFGKKG